MVEVGVRQKYGFGSKPSLSQNRRNPVGFTARIHYPRLVVPGEDCAVDFKSSDFDGVFLHATYYTKKGMCAHLIAIGKIMYNIRSMKFEDNLAKLEDTVRKMESGDLSLDQMIASFEEGRQLIDKCTKDLESIRLRIEKVTKDGGVENFEI